MSKIGFIYKIHCNETGEDYYGSTNNLNKRMSMHKCSTEKHLSKRQCESRKIIERNNYKVEVIETLNYDDKTELKIREQHYLDTCICINKFGAYQSLEDKKAAVRERGKSEKGLKEKATYRENNRDYLAKCSRERYALKKEEINAKRCLKIICSCGQEITQGKHNQHLKTAKHERQLLKLSQ